MVWEPARCITPVRSRQWTLTVTGADQGTIDKLAPKILTQMHATSDLVDTMPHNREQSREPISPSA